jgi:hypothetical protein
MPVRPTMQDLIVRVRSLYGDPAGASSKFDDQTIQDALDRERTDFILGDYRELLGRYTLPGSPPSYAWTDYFDPSGWGDWEADATLYNGAMVTITPTTSDLLTGHWTFAVTQPPPVFLMGKTFDVYAAARTLVLRWLALEATTFDFSAIRGTAFQPSQKRAGLKLLADELATEMRVRTAKLVRHDTYGQFTY